MKKYIKLIRIHHYIKNFLIFLPLIFSGKLFESNNFVITSLGAIAFCLISSVVYIVNDIRDIEKDRQHSTKKNRPLASGAVSIKSALILASIFVLVALIILFCFIGVSINAMILFMLYFVLNMLYSFGLKNKPIIDIAILVAGFILRVLFGATIVGIEISNWLYLTIMSISFYLSLGKRRNEVLKETGSREVLKYYSYEFLDKNMYIAMACAFVFYALWCVDPTTIARFHSNLMIWTVPLVIIIGMKYSLNIEGNSDGDPVEVIVRDKILLLLGAIYVVIVLVLLYA